MSAIELLNALRLENDDETLAETLRRAQSIAKRALTPTDRKLIARAFALLRGRRAMIVEHATYHKCGARMITLKLEASDGTQRLVKTCPNDDWTFARATT